MINELESYLLLKLIANSVLLIIVVSLLHHYFVGNKHSRARLLYKLRTLRLSKLLDCLGVSISRYLRKTPTKEIVTQIGRCECCQHIAQCDYCLLQGQCKQNMEFCPNYTVLRKLCR